MDAAAPDVTRTFAVTAGVNTITFAKPAISLGGGRALRAPDTLHDVQEIGFARIHLPAAFESIRACISHENG